MVDGNDLDNEASMEVQKAAISAAGSIDKELIEKQDALKR